MSLERSSKICDPHPLIRRANYSRLFFDSIIAFHFARNPPISFPIFVGSLLHVSRRRGEEEAAQQEWKKRQPRLFSFWWEELVPLFSVASSFSPDVVCHEAREFADPIRRISSISLVQPLSRNKRTTEKRRLNDRLSRSAPAWFKDALWVRGLLVSVLSSIMRGKVISHWKERRGICVRSFALAKVSYQVGGLCSDVSFSTSSPKSVISMDMCGGFVCVFWAFLSSREIVFVGKCSEIISNKDLRGVLAWY